MSVIYLSALSYNNCIIDNVLYKLNSPPKKVLKNITETVYLFSGIFYYLDINPTKDYDLSHFENIPVFDDFIAPYNVIFMTSYSKKHCIINNELFEILSPSKRIINNITESVVHVYDNKIYNIDVMNIKYCRPADKLYGNGSSYKNVYTTFSGVTYDNIIKVMDDGIIQPAKSHCWLGSVIICGFDEVYSYYGKTYFKKNNFFYTLKNYIQNIIILNLNEEYAFRNFEIMPNMIPGDIYLYN